MGRRPLPPCRCGVIPERRTAVVTARVSAAEFADWRAMTRTRTWTARSAEVERERTREVGRIGNNLNQIPRSANGTVFSRHWDDASGGTPRPVQKPRRTCVSDRDSAQALRARIDP